jgi:hypothetical protein
MKRPFVPLDLGPEEPLEDDIEAHVSAWPKENLKGVGRDEALQRIHELVEKDVVDPGQARLAIWRWGDGDRSLGEEDENGTDVGPDDKLEVPLSERPASSDPDWASKALLAIGRAATRRRLVQTYDSMSKKSGASR